MTVPFPRLSFTPIECYVVVAQHNAAENSYDVLANFQGPFSIHPVMARALRVPGPKLRLRIPPDSGGSFGIKLSVFPYVVLMALAAKITGRPVKWVEDRIEHLVAASSGPNRVTEIEAAVNNDGRILALKLDQLEDYGAFLRAPMPGPLYRMHGAVTGAYDIATCRREKPRRADQQNAGEPHSRLRRPAALSGAGAADAAHRGRAETRSARRHPAQSHSGARNFPYRTAAGALYDSGDYARAVEIARGDGRLDELKRRRDAARAAGRIYGIGFAAVVEPAMSNMGYLSTLMTAAAREKAGPKNGAVSMATVNIDPLGAVTVTADVTVQGQSHETVLAQIVAEQLGLNARRYRSGAGNGHREGPMVDRGRHLFEPLRLGHRGRRAYGRGADARQAQGHRAKQLNVLPDDVELAGGKIRSRSNPDNALPFGRVAGTSHWSPVLLPEGMAPALSETGVWSPPELEPPSHDDRINTSLTYGFIFDMCGVEIDPVTYAVRVDRYVSMHDAGRILNPTIADGQIRGAFAQGIAAALYEEFTYNEEGAFLSGTFADYLVPTVSEIPEVEILHYESPSPFTPLGAKGLAEGNCMSTPVCIANAIADALSVRDVILPATPRRIHALMEER